MHSDGCANSLLVKILLGNAQQNSVISHILMSSRSLNEILIKIPTELFNFIFAAYNLHFILPLVVYICTQRDGACRIQQRCFIYSSMFAIPALHKRRVQGHCAVYHFRMYDNLHSQPLMTQWYRCYVIKNDFIEIEINTHLITMMLIFSTLNDGKT